MLIFASCVSPSRCLQRSSPFGLSRHYSTFEGLSGRVRIGIYQGLNSWKGPRGGSSLIGCCLSASLRVKGSALLAWSRGLRCCIVCTFERAAHQLSLTVQNCQPAISWLCRSRTPWSHTSGWLVFGRSRWKSEGWPRTQFYLFWIPLWHRSSNGPKGLSRGRK
jgi:hypothetical protein